MGTEHSTSEVWWLLFPSLASRVATLYHKNCNVFLCADLARTLLLRADTASPVIASFTDSVRRYSEDRRGFDVDASRSWTPIIAAARLAEGFGGPYATWLTKIALINE